MEKFWIEYEVKKADCEPPPDESNIWFEGFMENALVGNARIGCGEELFLIQDCGLLALSRSLIRLCTFPVLYGIEAFESVLDEDYDFRSNFRDGNIVLAISPAGEDEESMLAIPLSETLQTVGAFNRDLLTTLFQTCPDLRDYGTLTVRIPDAFALAYTVCQSN